MRRREFLGGVAATAAAWSFAADAQQNLPVVGFLNSAAAAPFASLTRAFVEGLGESPFRSCS
jgi:hypothetical protein